MKETVAEQVRSAWFVSVMSAADVAQKFGLKSGNHVRLFWSREKAAGRLPDRERCAVYVDDEIAEPDIDAVFDENDTSPIGGPMGLRIPSPDPLLAALQIHHGADTWRHLDGMPERVLLGEFSRVAKIRRHRAVTAKRVRALAVLRDAIVGALIKLQAKNERTLANGR